MAFIIFAFIFGIIGSIISMRSDSKAYKQILKYDKEHSDIACADLNELAEKIKAVNCADVEQVRNVEDKIIVDCKKNSYSLRVENGVAYVEYDKNGCGLKISPLGRFIRIFRVAIAGRKAIVINSIMDCVAGKDAKLFEKEYKTVHNGLPSIIVFMVAMLVCVIIGCVLLLGEQNDKVVEKVKGTEYYSGVTYGELLDSYLLEQEWTSFTTDGDRACVEVDGVGLDGEAIEIQFLGELGYGFSNIENRNFKIYYAGIDGESYDPDFVMDMIYEYLYYSL